MKDIHAKEVDGVTAVVGGQRLICEKEVRKRRGNRSTSSFANDRRDGTWVEPVYVGGGAKLKFYPEIEVEILIAQEVAGATKDEKRALVKNLMNARRERFDSLVYQFQVAA